MGLVGGGWLGVKLTDQRTVGLGDPERVAAVFGEIRDDVFADGLEGHCWEDARHVF